MAKVRKQRSRKRGVAFVASLILMILLAVAGATYVSQATQSFRLARHRMYDVQTTHLCEAGVQQTLRALWRPFKAEQTFSTIDTLCSGAAENDFKAVQGGSIDGIGRFAAGVINIHQPVGDSYTRLVKIRAVGWLDFNNNGSRDNNEPQKTVDVTASYQLARSQVFDYTYFVNNYGWMSGFDPTDLIINGDMRANGNFDFLNGTPTVNGSVFAAVNDKLTPPAVGLINTGPVKWADNTYRNHAKDNPRARQGYQTGAHGNQGTAEFDKWRDFVFSTDGSVVGNESFGAVLGDSTGLKGWTRTSEGQSASTNMLDPEPTNEVIMPDLSDISHYQNLSTSYVDTKQTFGDGTTNPNYGKGASVEVWNAALNKYVRIDTNGVVAGSAILVGSQTKPIKIHGPVTFLQDAVIKGYVSGQGTIYTGRNVHVVGSLRYSDPPDFRGNNMQAIDNANEKKDMLALAARGSVILGNPKDFTNDYPLKYMTPPFTKGRYDDNGNWIPPFNAKEVDGTGFMRYQSVLGNAALDLIDEPVGQIDAILYTNFVGGGNIGTGGGTVHFNGSIISKDEAMVVWTKPMYMNYDHRIRERSLGQKPLIDLQLPRSPVMLRSTWQDRGFSFD